MPQKFKIELIDDEVEILIDALETDLEGYVEAAKDARANGNRTDVETFGDAAKRIGAVLEKMRALLPPE